ncbi:MAG: pyridoxal-phosphate dependent enzyme [Fimbriimonadaceae bacterium]
MSLPTYADVVLAAGRLEGVANRTPVFTSRTLDALSDAKVFVKAESFQRAGAFKFRGAYNALSQFAANPRDQTPHGELPQAVSDESARAAGSQLPAVRPSPLLGGVLTFSSGNHAAALSLAGSILGIHVVIVMPSDAPEIKIAATRGYGGEVILYQRSETTREALGQQIAAERGLAIVPPYDDPHIVAGAGTAAKELFDEVGDLDFLLVPCGGGGLLSGSALSAKALSLGCRVIGVEPEAGDDGARSFASGVLQMVENPVTIADGARTPSLGPNVTFPLIQDKVQGFLTVSDDEIVHSMRFLWERMKLIIEPTGALALAALLQGKVDAKSMRIGVILSGGNVDIKHAFELFAQHGSA